MKEQNWKKMLRDLKLSHIKRTAPSFYELSGGDRMKTQPYKDSTANGLTKCIIDFITFSGGYANRISSTGIMRKIRGEMKWTRGNTNKGSADIRAVIKGQSLDIEVKIGRDEMSLSQLREKIRVEAAGEKYFIAKDFPSFLQYWESLGFTITSTLKTINNGK